MIILHYINVPQKKQIFLFVLIFLKWVFILNMAIDKVTTKWNPYNEQQIKAKEYIILLNFLFNKKR